jgi:hypothetical protein
MTYWLNLFTGRTWHEFQAAGAAVSGFRAGRSEARARKINRGDVFLCYLVGVSRWVGLLQIESEQFNDQTEIFSEEVFPVRFRVKPVMMLSPEHGVPMDVLQGKLSFYSSKESGKHWSGHVRTSLTKYSMEDGQAIAAAIRFAAETPVARPVDQRKLQRSANLYKTKVKSEGEEIERVISIPRDEEEDIGFPRPAPEVSHTEIQWRLLDLGVQMGLNVWAPRNDRGRSWNGKTIGDIPRMMTALPTQFDKVTNEIVGAIDVLWFSGPAIVAAFEVEHSTSIYSGLLRMSDLLTMQPNLDIKLYLVGPDDRQTKFEKEVARATFASRRKPLHSLCAFLPYSAFCRRLEEASNFVQFLKPEFLDDIAILYDPASDVDE